MHFFTPQVFNLHSADGKAACEFPVLYYLTALCYHAFNQHEFILRLITILIASIGFLHLFQLLKNRFDSFTHAFIFSFVFISSTVMLYYTNNFLPDASALGFTFIGTFLFFKFVDNKNNKRILYMCFAFYTLASLLKVTYFINPVTAFISILIYGNPKKNGLISTLKNNTLLLKVFALATITVLSWNLYVSYYNNINNDHYFLIRPMPVWLMSKPQIYEVVDYIFNFWFSKYYYPTTFHLFFILTAAGIFFIKKSDRIILIPGIILAIGSLCYMLLFFSQFKDHDYYFITLIPAIVLINASSFITLKNKFPRLINNWITKLLFLTICFLSLNYAKAKLMQRYTNSHDQFSETGFQLVNAKQFLDSLNIPSDAKIIIIKDQTPNGGLYFINRQGWNIKDTTAANAGLLKTYINQGADYILLTDKNFVLKTINGLKIGTSDNLVLYKLNNSN